MPLGALVRELIATRRGKAKIGTRTTLPGSSPEDDQGVRSATVRPVCGRTRSAFDPQQDRSTALFTLAAELPAAILARMLGVHIQVAVH